MKPKRCKLHGSMFNQNSCVDFEVKDNLKIVK